MIRSFMAVTREIDDPEAALAEILAALNLEKNLLRHSLGIVSCFSEFEETGVLRAVCGALPFDCIGATTCLCSACGETDEAILAVTVLTSDDCAFKTAEIPLGTDYEGAIASRLGDLLGQPADKPAFLLGYFPLTKAISGDMILAEIDKATGGIPIFGMMAVDHTATHAAARTIRNEEAFPDAVVVGAIYGEPRVSFEIASIDKGKIRNQKAIITESNGNILVGVNGKGVLEYLGELGLTKEDVAVGMGLIPFVVDHGDGTRPVTRAIFALTPEDHAVCGGAMPEGATLALGRVETDDILRTTEDALRPLVEEGSVVLSYSCLARYFALGGDYTAEAERVRGIAGDTRYLFAYSGGEICPLPDAAGRLKNFFHNYTNVFCRLS